MLYVFAVLFVVHTGLTSFAESLDSCKTVISNSGSNDPTLFLDLKMFLENQRLMAVYEGGRPDWNNYNDVQQLILRAEKIKLTPEQKQALKNLASENSKVLQGFADNLSKKQNSDKARSLVNPTDRFLDYNIAYFRLLNELNTRLGVKIAPMPRFINLPSDRKLIYEAEALVRRLEKEVEDKFTNISHFGFKNLDEYNEFANKESESSAKLLKLTKSNLVVAVHRPESARFWIPIAGFQNQRVTQSSKGSLYPDTTSLTNISGRDKTEANLTQTKIEEYVPKSARFKPNYAEARPHHNQSEFLPGIGAAQYGKDLWIIKDDVISKRATWTPEDSLSPGWRASRGDGGFDDVFIPWKFRSLMIPFMNSKNVFYPSGINTSFNLKTRRWNFGSSYFEVQIFGPLSINDVKAFHFQGYPPDRVFYEYLKSKNIEVMDERTWPPKPYNGEESL